MKRILIFLGILGLTVTSCTATKDTADKKSSDTVETVEVKKDKYVPEEKNIISCTFLVYKATPENNNKEKIVAESISFIKGSIRRPLRDDNVSLDYSTHLRVSILDQEKRSIHTVTKRNPTKQYVEYSDESGKLFSKYVEQDSGYLLLTTNYHTDYKYIRIEQVLAEGEYRLIKDFELD